MNKTAKFKISIVIVISIFAGLIAIEHLDESWRNSDDWHNSSESVRNIMLIVTYAIFLPGLMFLAYNIFCIFHAVLYPFISRYAYFLYFSDFRYELVKGRSGMSAWFWVKKYGNWTIKVGHHGHMSDRNLIFRNELTYFITGIDICEEDLVKMNLNELVNNIYNGSRVFSIDPKGGSVLFSINDYFDTSDYKKSLTAAEFVLKEVKDYLNKNKH